MLGGALALAPALGALAGSLVTHVGLVAPDARLLVQVAEGGMFAFLLYWLLSITPG